MEDVQDLITKLDTYRSQLAQVEQALSADPSNETIKKLKHDLEEVIALTEDLVQFKPEEARESPENSPRAAAGDESPELPTSPTEMQTGSFVGRFCLAPFTDGKNYTAIIRNVKPDGKCLVDYVGGGPGEVPTSNIRLLQPPPAEKLVPGLLCQAIFLEDGLYYNARIEEVRGKGRYFVTFTEYNQSQEISADGIRLSAQAKKNDKKRSAEEMLANFQVPDKLKIKPTDSEDEKQIKKKKIHSMKTALRRKKMEEETNAKQSTWKSFTKKVTTAKPKTGSISGGKLRESMFKSPDTVDGKVGVTGSGKGMTHYSQLGKYDGLKKGLTDNAEDE
eukprot:GILK01002481.1.p1 GENE.GILK01002481.1~~GILK01002481.1.p1  ORF type:complete len:352 (-),score=62.52 GILK01002481.1:206-1204(-)